LAFNDIAQGRAFSSEDAAAISRLAGQLADEIMEVRHGRA
jgi:hypothetical protein